MKNKVSKKVRCRIIVILCVCLLFVLPGFYNGLLIQNYKVDVDNICYPVRIALITDLHSCNYGENGNEIIDLLNTQNPDLVLLGGDIFDDVLSDSNASSFLQELIKYYPCYYVTGNHECWSGRDAFAEKMEILEQYGVVRLSGDMATITINGTTINICGVDDPDIVMVADSNRYPSMLSFEDQIAKVSELSDNDNYTILLTHRPEYMEQYTNEGFDLVLSGHAHGGQWSLPGIQGGLYAPNQGLFPQYVGGEYQINSTTMIVSRGLAKESTAVPRFYNRPEIVIIDLI